MSNWRNMIRAWLGGGQPLPATQPEAYCVEDYVHHWYGGLGGATCVRCGKPRVK